MTVYLRLLGPLEVCDERTSRKVGGVKERTLLVLLALHSGAVVSVDAIADALWGEDPPSSVAKGIPVLVTRLRKVLAAAPALPVDIERVADGYRLRVPGGGVDVAVAGDLARSGELAAAAGELDQAARVLARAEALWRGPSLADVRDLPFAMADARRLDELRVALLEARLDVDLQRGRHDAALPELEAACVAYPWRERLWALRMLALHRSGRSAEALRAFHNVRAIFDDELGLEPGEELRGLEVAIIRDDPSLRLEDERRERRLPEGEVTFVLTDVADSTKLWERAADSMATALVRHDAMVDHVVGSYGGVVLKARGEGNSAFCVFDDPVLAVTAAFELQRTLIQEDWPADAPLRVRMAVHTGPAEQRDNSYFGSTVNRVARLRDAGHGGQLLLSAATAALVRQRLPAGASMRDLGRRRLRDLLEPERIFQLEHPALPARFPPLQSLDARPNNLPVQATSFVGRDDVLATLAELLRKPDCRLATLSGPGGMGKTRLALRAAADVIDDFADGVWFVPLAPVADPAAVPVAIAAALGLRTDGGPVVDALVDHLRERSLLLVLDNFEHVLDAADVLPGILAACVGVKVLATSREWLHLRGEHELQLDPLDDEAASALFVERARAVRIDADRWLDPAAVAEVCRRVDGLPLAIELVAARLRQLSLDDLVTRLRDVLDLAAEGPRDQPARQRTLRDTLAWSVCLLDDGERGALERLSVFRGGWTLDAAVAVIGAEFDDTAIVLASLADKSLVVQPTPARYDMLQTIRAYATERLAQSPDVLRATELAHFDYWVAYATSWLESTGLDESMFEGIDIWTVTLAIPVELDNLRAALQFGVTHRVGNVAPVAVTTALVLRELDSRESLNWVEAAAAKTVDETWRYWLLFAEVSSLWQVGRFDDVVRVASTAISLVERVRPAGLPSMWNFVGIAQWRLGRLTEADASLRAGLDSVNAAGSPPPALLTHNLGLVEWDRGDLAAATRWFELTRDSAHGTDTVMERVVELRLGQIATERGLYEDTVRWCRPLLGSTDALALTRVMAAEELIRALCFVGDPSAAADVAEEATMVAADGPPSAQVVARVALALARIGVGDLLGALDAAEEAEALARRSSYYEGLVRSLHTLGRVHRHRDDLQAAARALTLALESSGAHSQSSVRVGLDLAVVEREAGDASRGWARMVEVFRQSVELGRVLHAARACRYLADAAVDAGDLGLASVLLDVSDRTRRAAGIERDAPGEAGETARRMLEEHEGELATDGADRGLSLEMVLDLLERSVSS